MGFNAGNFKMKSMTQWLSAGLVFLGASSIGNAQQGGPAIAYPINNWSYVRHSSTYAEGALRGQAAVISSAGQAVYLDSLAAINYAEAVRRVIENSLAATKAYYERREIREEYVKKYGPKPFIGEARRKAIEYYQPKRLSAQEFDPQQQKVTWPHILRQQHFAAIVSQIDATFSSRTMENSGDGSATHRNLLQLCNALNGILKENISNVTPDQYIHAMEFIRSVELEARTPVPANIQRVNADSNPQVPPPNSDKDTAKGQMKTPIQV